MYLSRGRVSPSLGYKAAGKPERHYEDYIWEILIGAPSGPHLEVCPRTGRYGTTLINIRTYRDSLWGYRLFGALYCSQARYESPGYQFSR